MKKSMFTKLVILLLAVVLLMAFGTVAAAKKVKVGGLIDCTGATSDVGKDYAIGMMDAFKYINSQGGVNRKKIK